MRDALLSINDEESDIAALQPPAGHDHAKFFRDQCGFALAPNSSGVHEAIVAAVARDFRVNVVHGRPGNGRDDGALLANHAVQQSRLANVGPADDGDLDDLR